MRRDSDTSIVRELGTHVPLVLLALISVLVFTGCSSSGTGDGDSPTQAASTAPSGMATLLPATATPASSLPPSDEIPPTPISTVVPVATQGSEPANPSPNTFFLELIEPSSLEIVVNEPDLIIGGHSLAEALITVNDEIVVPDIDGLFGALVTLEPGPNIIEIVGSTFDGETGGLVLTAVYLP